MEYKFSTATFLFTFLYFNYFFLVSSFFFAFSFQGGSFLLDHFYELLAHMEVNML